MKPYEIRDALDECKTALDLELAFSKMRVPDIKHIVDTFTAFSELSQLTMRDEYILSQAHVAYNKMVGNIKD